jgi:hypothetical protein
MRHSYNFGNLVPVQDSDKLIHGRTGHFYNRSQQPDVELLMVGNTNRIFLSRLIENHMAT